jgi:hypothetical protein
MKTIETIYFENGRVAKIYEILESGIKGLISEFYDCGRQYSQWEWNADQTDTCKVWDQPFGDKEKTTYQWDTNRTETDHEALDYFPY